MSEKSLIFKLTESEDEVKNIYNHNVQVFTDTQDFGWTFENIKSEIKDGWKLYSVFVDDIIIAALFIKADNGTLFTKNTPIKMQYQGNGFSHFIKEFYEEEAVKLGMGKVINYCPVDNFRMISLNEGHKYKKTGNTLGNNEDIIEWEKTVNS